MVLSFLRALFLEATLPPIRLKALKALKALIQSMR
nr:MAG TPA: hypothetical protein [Caudoviricetes sp.]